MKLILEQVCYARTTSHVERGDYMTVEQYASTEKLAREFAAILSILVESGYHFSEFDQGRLYEMMNSAKMKS